MTKYVVAAVAELPPGSRKLVELEGRSIGVFNVNGEFFALRNRCPHQGGPLCEGKIGAQIESNAPGEYRMSRPAEMLRCPWHGWEFDLRTGQSWWNPARQRVRQYPVSVAESSSVRPGPYMAETLPVTVEEQVVIVELASSML